MDDLLFLEEHYPDDTCFIRDTLRRFCDEQVLPTINEHYEKATFPTDILPKLAQLGLFGMTLPREYGGSEASYLNYGVACRELERADSGLRSAVSVQSSLCMYPIFTYGSDAQKHHYLPKMAKGECIGCFGLTEPNAGSDPASMQTVAKKVTGGWVLNGTKLWITNATIADLAIVWAQTEEGIRGFIVDKVCSGFTQNEIKHKMSLRASITGELVFQECFVSDDHYLPGSKRGLAAPLSCLSQARYGIVWGVMGAAQACFDTALAYLKEREQFGRSLASFQLVQKDLAYMFTEIIKAECVNNRLAELKQQNRATPAMISMAKMNHCREALTIARMARNLLGANGISLEYPVIRHMNNLESVLTYEGTENVHTLILGKHITGLNALGR